MIYVVSVPGFVKVGFAKDPADRLRDYQCENPLVDAFDAVFPGTKRDEKAIQDLHCEPLRTNEFIPPFGLQRGKPSGISAERWRGGAS